MTNFVLRHALNFAVLILMMTAVAGAARACGTYVDFGSIYVRAEPHDDLSDEDRVRCKLGAIGAMLCVSQGLRSQENAEALIAEVLRDARSSDDPRLKCMGRHLAQHLGATSGDSGSGPAIEKSDFYARGEQLFDTICSRDNLEGHDPFGVRVFGPGQIAAEECAKEIMAGQE